MKMKQMKSTNTIFDRWIPREQVRAFFGYGQTKMCSFSSDHNVRSRKVGNKQFFFADDIKRLLESDLTDES